MEQLISMRQRIKAVETIKKITHAMRLISMSTHARLRNKKDDLQKYKDAFLNLWTRIQPSLDQKVQQKNQTVGIKEKKLIVLVGSQKGLCGTFNSNLFKYFESLDLQDIDYYVSIGKYATDFLTIHNKPILAAYNTFNSSNFVHVAQTLTTQISKIQDEIGSATLISNHPKSFFVHEPKQTNLFSMQPQDLEKRDIAATEYIIEQQPIEVGNTIEQLMLMIHIQELLYGSLLAEQSARFISMDNATQNADSLLQNMHLEYNKIRQAAITRELTELSSSY